MPIVSGTPAAQRNPSTADARPAIDSTDRSISPAMMIRVIAMAMIATSIRAAMRLEKLPGVRKNGDSEVPSAISPSRAMTSRVSQRARRLVHGRPPTGLVVALVIGRSAGRWRA